MTGVSVTVDNAEVTRALTAMATRLGNLRPAMELIGQAVATETDLGFRAQTDPWGNPWPQLSAVTMAKRRGTSAQILRDTGRLQNSISASADASSVVVGTNAKYAGTHQFGAKQGAYGRTKRGGPIPWGDVPRRAMLPLNQSGNLTMPQDQITDILDILRLHLERRG